MIETGKAFGFLSRKIAVVFDDRCAFFERITLAGLGFGPCFHFVFLASDAIALRSTMLRKITMMFTVDVSMFQKVTVAVKTAAAPQ